MADPSTSVSLLERVLDRDTEAWNHLYYLYTPLVAHWCQAWGVQGPDADDLRQEVFQAVATGLPTFRRDRPGDSFRGWLRAIARRKFLDYCRRQDRQPTAQGGTTAQLYFLQVAAPVETDQDDPPLEIRRLHHRALDLVRSQFELRTWQAFWRSAVEGAAPADVGRELAMTPAAVRQAKSRVLRRLKLEFADLLAPPGG